MKNFFSRRLQVATVTTAALLLAACGGSTSGTSSAPNRTLTPSTNTQTSSSVAKQNQAPSFSSTASFNNERTSFATSAAATPSVTAEQAKAAYTSLASATTVDTSSSNAAATALEQHEDATFKSLAYLDKLVDQDKIVTVGETKDLKEALAKAGTTQVVDEFGDGGTGLRVYHSVNDLSTNKTSKASTRSLDVTASSSSQVPKANEEAESHKTKVVADDSGYGPFSTTSQYFLASTGKGVNVAVVESDFGKVTNTNGLANVDTTKFQAGSLNSFELNSSTNRNAPNRFSDTLKAAAQKPEKLGSGLQKVQSGLAYEASYTGYDLVDGTEKTAVYKVLKQVADVNQTDVVSLRVKDTALQGEELLNAVKALNDESFALTHKDSSYVSALAAGLHELGKLGNKAPLVVVELPEGNTTGDKTVGATDLVGLLTASKYADNLLFVTTSGKQYDQLLKGCGVTATACVDVKAGDNHNSALGSVVSVAALVKQNYPWMTAKQVRDTILTTTTQDGKFNKVTGWQTPDAERAVYGPRAILGDTTWTFTKPTLTLRNELEEAIYYKLPYQESYEYDDEKVSNSGHYFRHYGRADRSGETLYGHTNFYYDIAGEGKLSLVGTREGDKNLNTVVFTGYVNPTEGVEATNVNVAFTHKEGLFNEVIFNNHRLKPSPLYPYFLPNQYKLGSSLYTNFVQALEKKYGGNLKGSSWILHSFPNFKLLAPSLSEVTAKSLFTQGAEKLTLKQNSVGWLIHGKFGEVTLANNATLVFGGAKFNLNSLEEVNTESAYRTNVAIDSLRLGDESKLQLKVSNISLERVDQYSSEHGVPSRATSLMVKFASLFEQFKTAEKLARVKENLGETLSEDEIPAFNRVRKHYLPLLTPSDLVVSIPKITPDFLKHSNTLNRIAHYEALQNTETSNRDIVNEYVKVIREIEPNFAVFNTDEPDKGNTTPGDAGGNTSAGNAVDTPKTEVNDQAAHDKYIARSREIDEVVSQKLHDALLKVPSIFKKVLRGLAPNDVRKFFYDLYKPYTPDTQELHRIVAKAKALGSFTKLNALEYLTLWSNSGYSPLVNKLQANGDLVLDIPWFESTEERAEERYPVLGYASFTGSFKNTYLTDYYAQRDKTIFIERDDALGLMYLRVVTDKSNTVNPSRGLNGNDGSTHLLSSEELNKLRTASLVSRGVDALEQNVPEGYSRVYFREDLENRTHDAVSTDVALLSSGAGLADTLLSSDLEVAQSNDPAPTAHNVVLTDKLTKENNPVRALAGTDKPTDVTVKTTENGVDKLENFSLNDKDVYLQARKAVADYSDLELGTFLYRASAAAYSASHLAVSQQTRVLNSDFLVQAGQFKQAVSAADLANAASGAAASGLKLNTYAQYAFKRADWTQEASQVVGKWNHHNFAVGVYGQLDLNQAVNASSGSTAGSLGSAAGNLGAVNLGLAATHLTGTWLEALDAKFDKSVLSENQVSSTSLVATAGYAWNKAFLNLGAAYSYQGFNSQRTLFTERDLTAEYARHEAALSALAGAQLVGDQLVGLQARAGVTATYSYQGEFGEKLNSEPKATDAAKALALTAKSASAWELVGNLGVVGTYKFVTNGLTQGLDASVDVSLRALNADYAVKGETLVNKAAKTEFTSGATFKPTYLVRAQAGYSYEFVPGLNVRVGTGYSKTTNWGAFEGDVKLTYSF